jgi:hypothetical protein
LTVALRGAVGGGQRRLGVKERPCRAVGIAHVRDQTNLVVAAELLPRPLETTRLYTPPSAEDRAKAIDLLPVDE